MCDNSVHSLDEKGRDNGLRFRWILVLVFLVLSCSGAVGVHERTAGPTLGVIAPLTGQNAGFGQEMMRGVELGLEDINRQRSRRGLLPVRLVSGDSRSTVVGGQDALEKVRSGSELPLIVGPMFSSVLLELAPIAAANDIVLLSPTASASTLSALGPNVLSIYPSDERDAQLLAQFIDGELDAKSAGLFSMREPSTLSLSKKLQEYLEDRGVAVVMTEQFSAVEFLKPNLRARLVSSQPEVIVIAAYLQETVDLLKAIRAVGHEAAVIAISTCYSESLFALGGEETDGLLVSAPKYDMETSEIADSWFGRTYLERYGAPPPVWAAYGYDAIQIVGVVLEEKPSSARDVMDSLLKLGSYEGLTGRVVVGENQLISGELRMVEVQGRSFTPYRSSREWRSTQ